ncbi:MAG: EI24 domain-containing protein [Saprospiraceae bacterium]|nr:EI24 domain-containing protein [Saprospiraceae bacterium]MCF8252355.1 EI24 domain-containing protein [Saprospiraceae bacterium]MCF8282196.1 EI24 domain-containing protein [Bacteroidales bacterium]MCF8311853.1 EI24 domain-containing protein [Saprospiraceae bacterium]MCF8442697.1 EI24 domain-containing protein [Saprospiraceae bacterium]
MPPTPTTNANDSSYLDKGLENFHQFVGTLIMHKKAVGFVREHKPWRGLDRLGWIVWVIAIAGALLSFQFFQQLFNTFQELRSNQQPLTSTLSSVFSFEKIAWVAHGSRKYLIMIVMELVVFYIIQKTLEKQTGRKPELTTKAFIDAEMRIVSSTILAWILETIARFLVVNLALNILGFDGLKQPVGFLIQCYFLGFAMVDNYHECFRLTVSQSEKRTRRAGLGVALGTGLVAYLLMYVPVIGAFAAAIIGGVAATLAMERFAPLTEVERLVLIAAQQKRKEKKPRGRHASQ